MAESAIPLPLVDYAGSSHADCTAGPMDVVHKSQVCARVYMCITAFYYNISVHFLTKQYKPPPNFCLSLLFFLSQSLQNYMLTSLPNKKRRQN